MKAYSSCSNDMLSGIIVKMIKDLSDGSYYRLIKHEEVEHHQKQNYDRNADNRI